MNSWKYLKLIATILGRNIGLCNDSIRLEPKICQMMLKGDNQYWHAYCPETQNGIRV